ncbi:MAG: phosphotransferase family protein [Bacteroidia bacterium]|nr:phosphotransferase family protein [Bacteroidia bacterium]
MTSNNLDTSTKIRPGEELDIQALEAYLMNKIKGSHGPLVVEQFPGGASNLTYMIKLGERQMVLRRPPFGANIKGGHDMGREFKVLSSLSQHYSKVPAPVLFETDEDIIGAEFYIMDRIQGIIFRTKNGPAKNLDKQQIWKIADALIDTMVELHQLDYEAIGLGDLGRPSGFTARQVEGWTRRYQKAKTDEFPQIDEVAQWLASNVPEQCNASLIHNDFKHDNVIMDPEDPTKVLAVLDWEMCTLGDPLTDLGTTLSYWPNPEDPALMQMVAQNPAALPGNPRRQEVVEMYAMKSGNEVDNAVFYFAYGLFKLAGVVQQIYYRYHKGFTKDKRFANMNHFGAALGSMAALAIEKDKIYDLG